MRSTMTAYRAGSSIGVPPSVTISAVTPCSRPRVFTRSMNAGGKLYSRPQSNPIFIRQPSRTNQWQASALPHRTMASGAHHRGTRLVHHMPHDGPQVARFPEHRELPIGAGPVPQNRVHVFHVSTAPQLVDDVVHELQQLQRERPHGHFHLLAEVDQHPVDPPPRGAPLVLVDERAPIQA